MSKQMQPNSTELLRPVARGPRGSPDESGARWLRPRSPLMAVASFNVVWLAAKAAPSGPAATKLACAGWGPITFATAISRLPDYA